METSEVTASGWGRPLNALRGEHHIEWGRQPFRQGGIERKGPLAEGAPEQHHDIAFFNVPAALLP
jgi:hypothetical protein